MLSRRQVLYGGLGAVALGMLPGSRFRMARSLLAAPRLIRPSARPLMPIPVAEATVRIGDLPFADGFTGDPYPQPHAYLPGVGGGLKGWDGKIPPPSEETDVVVAGAGISGLGTAYLLRERRPIVLDMADRFGGNARGEVWSGINYSLGGAYVITPDPGTFLEDLYAQLGLDRVVRVDEGPMEIELNGELPEGFWEGAGLPPDEVAAFEAYARVVRYMADEGYPCIPTVPGDERYVAELDGRTFKEDVERQMGMPAPTLLASAIQAYCYSSFGAGWEEISAAGGWNFVAAEEYGRWVCPGGNSYIADQLWQKLAAGDTGDRPRLREASTVVDVRLNSRGVQVTYLDRDVQAHTIQAAKAALCFPKHACRHFIHDLENLDPVKYEAIQHLRYRAYVVANVLLNAPVELDFYDIFLLGDGQYPVNQDQAQKFSRVIDALNGSFAEPRKDTLLRSVLTLYWPLPWETARLTLTKGPVSWQNYAESVVPQVHDILGLLEVPAEAVRQVRLTAWGHGMPWSEPDLIAGGVTAALRQPIADRIFFVHQDNWALPAVENCLLDAEIYVPQILDGL